MKKTISVILAVLMVLSCISIATVSAADEYAKITLNGKEYNYKVGSEISYICKLKNSATIENGQFTLNYPGEILKIESVEFPVAVGVMYNYEENLVNQLKFNFSSINGMNFNSDDAVLTKVNFTVKAAGSGDITLDKEVLSNINDSNVLSSSVFTETLSDSICLHTDTTTKNARKATYFSKGYTGDKVCTACGVVVSKGKATAKKKLATPKMTVKAGKKSIKVKYSKVSGATGFQVSYKLKGKAAKLKKFDSKKTVTKTIKSLKKGKKYSVKIRAYVKSGKKYAYSSWTKAKNVKVK